MPCVPVRGGRSRRPVLSDVLFALLTGLLAAASVDVAAAQDDSAVQASALLDISGVSWMEGDIFVAVHDGKSDAEEASRPRVSLLLLPADVTTPPAFARQAPDGMYYQDLEVTWPSVVANDLESVARIPGTRQVLLVESGDDCSAFQRMFLATFSSDWKLTIDEEVPWPVSGAQPCAGVFNVEASAVFRLGDQLFFVYAERAEGQPYTELRWAPMETAPLRFGSFTSVRYMAKVRGEGVRPIVALDVAGDGRVFAAAAYDSGEDNGPFRSFVSEIGRFRSASGGGARFTPSGKFGDVAIQDGFKIEGVTVRPSDDGGVEVFAGTDDENYGAVLRQVAPIPVSRARGTTRSGRR